MAFEPGGHIHQHNDVRECKVHSLTQLSPFLHVTVQVWLVRITFATVPVLWIKNEQLYYFRPRGSGTACTITRDTKCQ